MVTTKERKVIYSIIYSLEKIFKTENSFNLKNSLLREIKDCKYWLKGEKENEFLKELIEFHQNHGTTNFRKLILPEIEELKTIKVFNV
jgi:CTP-dependent riboflavin kinase